MKVIKSKIVPIQRKDIDTDQIIPSDFLRGTKKEGMGEFLFYEIRKEDENFPLNLVRYSDAGILVADENFGCGSSREHAAWALADYGIEVVIAPSFADIFYNNALNNGILPVVLDKSVVDDIFRGEKDGGDYEIEVNLSEQKVLLPDGSEYFFNINPYKKECLIKGMNDLDYLLENFDLIERFERDRKEFIFFDITKL